MTNRQATVAETLVILLSVTVLLSLLTIARFTFNDDQTYVQLVIGVAWPAFAMTLVLVLRRHIGDALEAIARRTNKISAFQVELELATDQVLQPWVSPSLDDLRDPRHTDWSSDSSTKLFEQIQDASPSDFAIVDLGRGEEWLTSRLFIFAVMLQRMRGIKCIVFLRSRNDIERVFVGVATPECVRWSLAAHYPWLEKAYIQAYEENFGYGDALTMTAQTCLITSRTGSLEPYSARNVVTGFIKNITHAAIDPVAASESDDSVDLGNGRFERARWITESVIRELLTEECLHHEAVLHDLSQSDSAELKPLLRSTGAFVAVVDSRERFQGLVDRMYVLEIVSRSFLKSVDPNPSLND